MSELFGIEPTPSKQKSNEWFTPSKYIEAARQVMQGIDLDPASCEEANKTVKATRYYDQAMNGLTHLWYGKVFCNPPYQLVDKLAWTAKALEEYGEGHAEQIIMLVTAAPTNSWFQPFWRYPICFPNHRIQFNRPGKRSEHIREGACFVYLGSNEAKFIEVFSQFGRIAKAIDTPPAKPTMRELWEVSA